ncbi:interphotoreceptor matrix proteoglycan 2-like [Salarias fasciatus]|uniref:interphotoreceptor matrix proteoglycan 2-like n=1 Tax=Salarias fasciatus TaxID=181472 RepID=UPI001176980F|nr:interphotoreceptor matrix proteoglycan 2-like [Salarias fasciatus]
MPARTRTLLLLLLLLLGGCVSPDTGASSERAMGFQQRGEADTPAMLDSGALWDARRPAAPATRRRRNVLFPSGVKMCSQETYEQVVSNHLRYFHLRVCQETVWEAFKIFWDRLPERDEYQVWVSRCLDDSVSISDIGEFFSRSDEHRDLVRARVAMTTADNSSETTTWPSLTETSAEDIEGLLPETELEGTPEPEVIVGHPTEMEIPPEPTEGDGTTEVAGPESVPEAEEKTLEPATPEEVIPESAKERSTEEPAAPTTEVEDGSQGTTSSVEATTKYVLEYNNGNFPDLTEPPLDEDLLGNNGFGLEDEQETSIGNEIDTLLRPLRPLRDHVVELSIRLRGETYNDALRDPSSFEYQLLARQFTRRIEDAFERLPGFKGVSIIEFRPQKDLERGLVVLVHYTITLEVDGGGVANDTLDFISLQNNRVEKNFPGAAEQPTVVYTITDFRNYITEALHKDNFLTNSSLEAGQGDPLQLENAENLLPSVNPTSRPASAYDSMDNVLAAEKPPDAPSHEQDGTASEVFPKKDDFLFDPFDQWKGPQSEGASENDVFLFDEATAPPLPIDLPEKTFDLEANIPGSKTNLENEELLGAGDDTLPGRHTDGSKPLTTSEASLDDGSGSGFSGDDQGADFWRWEVSVTSDRTYIDGESGLEVLPPPDLEEDEDAFEPHTTEKDDLVALGVQFTETPEVQTTAASTPEDAEEFLDHVLVTVPVMTTTKPPVFSPKGTVELSVQTMEASGIYDDFSLTEPQSTGAPVTDPPLWDVWTKEAAVLPLQPEVLAEKPRLPPPPPVTPHQESIEVLEEQHIGVTDSSLPTASVILDRDLVVDEVMVVMTTTAAPVTTSTASLDHGAIGLSPERDSPFTRVSDSAPEDEDLIHHEHQNHEEVTELPGSSPPPAVTPSTPEVVAVKTESPPGGLPDAPQPDEDLSVTLTSPSGGEAAIHHKPTSSHEKVTDGAPESELEPMEFSDVPSIDVSFDVFQYGGGMSEGDSSGFSSGAQGSDLDAFALPAHPGRDLTVFFRLRVTNMVFSMDLFNKSSPEYKALEQRFLQLLVPYLQSNLNNFQNLEILNFRNGSIVVNSRMRFGKPVSKGVTNVIYLILEDFANTAYQTMNLAIDKYSLDVESGDRADPCKFQACNDFSRCMVNAWSGEAECVCDAGYVSVDGLPCQSVCDAQHDFCLNDGKCDIIPGKGAICRCRVGENWWYRGEHCEEYVSEPLVVGIAVASVAGFLSVAAGIIFFLARTLRDQYDGEDTEDPLRRTDSVPTLERATKFNPMFESDPVTAQYYRRYDDDAPQYYRRFGDPAPPQYGGSDGGDASKELSSEEIRNIYGNTTLTKEEIQERLRIIELCARDQHFADFVRQTQVFLERRGSSTT